MSRPPALLRFAAAAVAALALSGCISLLPKSKPAHLYRFGQPATSEPATPVAATVGVFRANGAFQRESSGDRLLTIDGGKAAYLAETRWVAPASILWDQAVTAAFEAAPGPVRLVARGEPAEAAYVLRLDVRNFEARYDHGARAAPTVVVRVRAVMIKAADKVLVNERIIERQVRARDNRVTAIVPAYDQAVGEVLSEAVAWTNAQAAAGA